MFTLRRTISFVYQNLRFFIALLLTLLVGVFIYNSQRITLGPFPFTAKSPNRLMWREVIAEDYVLLERPDMWRFWDRSDSTMGIVVRAGICDEAPCSLDELLENELERRRTRVRNPKATIIEMKPVDDEGIEASADCSALAKSHASNNFFVLRSRTFALDCGGKQITILAMFARGQRDDFDALVEKFVRSIEVVE